MKFFWKDATGLKADVNRHRAEEASLNAKIAELEAIKEPSIMDTTALRIYRGFLAQLQQSKAEVVSRIGR